MRCVDAEAAPQRSELFYLGAGSRGNLGIVGDEEDCHPFDRKWRGVDGRARTPRRARR